MTKTIISLNGLQRQNRKALRILHQGICHVLAEGKPVARCLSKPLPLWPYPSVHLPPSCLIRPIQLRRWCHLRACPAPPTTTRAVVGVPLPVAVPRSCGVMGLLPWCRPHLPGVVHVMVVGVLLVRSYFSPAHKDTVSILFLKLTEKKIMMEVTDPSPVTPHCSSWWLFLSLRRLASPSSSQLLFLFRTSLFVYNR
jgi:hypothetical protein